MAVASSSITLRPVGPGDDALLRRVYASTREEELLPVPWSDGEKDAFLRQQFDAQRAHYSRFYPDASHDVILAAGEPAGRLWVDRRPAEIRVVDIALLPEQRGQGIGTLLLRELLAEGAASGRPVTVHVEFSNPARSLYERLGFVEAKVEGRGVHVLMECHPPDQRSEA